MSDSVGLPGANSPAPSVGLPLPPVSPNGNGKSNSSSPPPEDDPASPPSPSSDSAPPPSPPAPPPDTPPPASSPPPEQSPPPPSTPPPSPNAPPPTPDSPPPSPDAPPPSPPSPPPNDSPPPAASTPPPTPEDVSPPAPPKVSESPNSPPPPLPEKPNSPPPSSSPPPPSSPESSPTKPSTPPPSQHIYSPPPPPTPVHAPSPKATPTVPGATGPTPSHLPPHDSISKSSSGQSNPAPADGGNGGNGYQQRTMVGMAVAGVVIVAFIAMVFVVRRRKKRHTDVYTNSQYFPTANFSIKSDGYYYGPNPHMAYSVQGGGPMYNSQQPSMAPNSFGSQRGYMASGGTPDSSGLSGAKTNFSYEELMEITNGFSRHNILGEGGFGCVYKGTLQDGKLVAVKQLKAASGQGDGGFKAEVEIISRVHHRHLVSLVGYCISDQHKLLIYEFVSNQTLEHHLHSRGMPVLEWAKRVKIAIGSAKGLAYLHEDCHPKIIHRDIKSANILLDDDFEAQVADFGLARLNDTTQTHVSTRVMGTFGYMAPEYASSGKLTDRSDVFSFGVVLLELITGRKPVDPEQPLGEESLVEWARPLLLKAVETGEFSELVDSRLEKHYVENEVFRMIETAAACVRHSAPKRPRMVQVVRALDCEGEMSDISNGVKVGQSMAYDSGQYSQDIMKFRQMAFGFDDTSDSGMLSGDHSVRSSQKSPDASTEFTAINRRF